MSISEAKVKEIISELTTSLNDCLSDGACDGECIIRYNDNSLLYIYSRNEKINTFKITISPAKLEMKEGKE